MTMRKPEHLNEARMSAQDPIIDVVAARAAAGRAVDKFPDEADDDRLIAIIAQCDDVLETWRLPIQSRIGAIQALQVAIEEQEVFGTELHLCRSLLRLVLAYLETH
jgi:hypothetical protein